MNNEMLIMIQKNGVNKTAELIAEYVNQKIPSEDVAMQFILEEVEAASKGNEEAKLFAQTSGFDESDYLGAMGNSFEEVDGANGPQQEILNLCMMLYPNQQLMAELRIKTVDNIMKHWKLGKYAAVNENLKLIDVVKKTNDLDEGVFANINNDLNESITQDYDVMILMAYGYARRTVAAGLYLQGVFNRANYEQASNIFKSLQIRTGQSVEFQEEAASQALELLQSYDYRLDKELISTITSVVALNQVENLYGSYEKVLSLYKNSTTRTWKDKLIQWAQKNNLPSRETKINFLGEPEYIGFPHDIASIDYFLNIQEFNIYAYTNGTRKNYINLSGYNLTNLPEEIYLLKGIYALWLDSNKLTKLSESIDKLEFLYSLDLGNNNLTSLPNNIVNLKYLNNIRLYNNPNLVLTKEQKDWILSLNPKEVICDDDLFERSILIEDTNDDEIPF